MNSIYLPIIGQGSQPQEEDGAELAFMPLPNTMTTYVMPQLPPDLDVKAMTRAKALFQAVLEALKNYQSGQNVSFHIHSLITGLFDTGNPGTLTLTQEMKTRLENAGYLTVERQDYSYGRYEPYLSATLRKISFNNQVLDDIHNLHIKIGKDNEIGLGYQFLKHYVSVWNFKNKTITLLKQSNVS